MALAALYDDAPLGLGIGDHLLDLCHGGLVDQRPLLNAFVGPVPNHHGGHGLFQFCDKSVMNARLDKEPIGAHTGLAHIAELGDHRAFDGGVQVRVIKDDERRVAAQFHRDLLDPICRLPDQGLADVGRPVNVTFRTSGLSMIAPPSGVQTR